MYHSITRKTIYVHKNMFLSKSRPHKFVRSKKKKTQMEKIETRPAWETSWIDTMMCQIETVCI